MSVEKKAKTASRALTIAYVVPGLDCSGGIRVAFEHCRRLRSRGHRVWLATEGTTYTQDWFPHLDVPIGPAKVLEALSPDVVVATGCTTPWSINSLGFKATKFYLIQGQDLYLDSYPGWLERADATYRMRDYELIVVSEYLRAWLRTGYGREATVVENGVDMGLFYPDVAFPKSDRFRVLIEGSLAAPHKGVAEAFAACEGVGAEVWCVTNEGETDRADRFWLLPDQDTLRRIYSSCDVLLKMSVAEGSGLPHMEAMACGCPVVTTDVPGISSYAHDEYNCLKVPVGDVAAARSVLMRLREDSDLRDHLKRNGLETARSRFGWEDKIAALERLYVAGALRRNGQRMD